MANKKGSTGVIKVGLNVIAEILSFSVEQSGETIEDTIIGETAKTFQSGMTSWNGSAEAHWDTTDTTAQGAMTIGAEVALNMFPGGDGSGDTQLAGNAIITGVSLGGMDNSGMVKASFSFQGTGVLTESTVV